MAQASVVVFGSSRVPRGSSAYALAAEVGRALARRGAEVRCGGYGGVMEGLALGAKEAGGRVVGCTLEWFAGGRTANRHLDEERPSPDLPSRLDCLLQGTRAAIALPGGVGTLNEVFWLWTLLLHGHGGMRRLVLLGEPWGDLLSLLEARFEIDPPIRALVMRAGTAEEAAALACGAEAP